MKVFILQPPITQFNTVYPSGAYLSGFFKLIETQKPGVINGVKWKDLNIKLFEKIFSQEGLKIIFDATREYALNRAAVAEKNGNTEEAFQLRRYIMMENKWINWIDGICEILQNTNSSRELCHEFIFSPHKPIGLRMENFFAAKENITIDDARMLASFAIADISDYITECYDKNFSLVRYAEHIATSETSFDNFLNALDSPIMKNFFVPILEKFFQGLESELESELSEKLHDKFLFCVSVPFPGCFISAMVLCKKIKEWCLEKNIKSIVSIGGGYCSTELRETEEIRLEKFIDIISYDRGYGSYLELIENLIEDNFDFEKTLSKPIYNCRVFHNGKIIFDEEKNHLEKYLQLDNEYTKKVFPNYDDIDFSPYPRMCDDENPMHRIWSDGSWIKAYLAHGCYWHRCTFCDTTLDYVCNYKMIDAEKLFYALQTTSEKTGVYGIHFVDEAAPPVSLKKFALLNCGLGTDKYYSPFTFWGNVRFEKAFTRDLCDLLSFGGLTAVSGGIEIATNNGLDSVNKGTEIQDIICALCAFKEAGILVHAYMIFGFHDETPQQLIDSMETLRQLFAAGLLDSAFWHKFTLTKHSTLFAKWKKGECPNLKPILNNQKNLFAHNDINFQGENKSEKYSAPLEVALSNWMHGHGLEKKVWKWFNWEMPKPTIPSDFVERVISVYEKKRDAQYKDYEDFLSGKKDYLWLGGTIIVIDKTIVWTYMGEDFSFTFDSKEKAKKIAELLFTISLEGERKTLQSKVKYKEEITPNLYNKLRGKGLVRI